MPVSPLDGWNFQNSYATLPERFFAYQKPTPVRDPAMVLFNEPLADELGLEIAADDEKALAMIFSGNTLPDGSNPIAQAYAGHQFGHFTMLGDGRAVLLGEHRSPDGRLWDIQLKGSGITPFSRRGDGRATLKSMLREFLIAEAMHGLGIPTSRALAVVSTGEPVYREADHVGAVLTRVAASHLRVGTFEYAAQYLGTGELKQLVDYAIQRHYPECSNEENRTLALFNQVLDRQAYLMAEWMRVGFIHGVMNTDNMSISGETIDYGPCAFLNSYDPSTVFSSIDTHGRYAFGNQPKIAQWNLSCLASALLPLLDEKKETAIKIAQEALNRFPGRFTHYYTAMMRKKLGLSGAEADDAALISDLDTVMGELKLDYTHTFLLLQGETIQGSPQFADPSFQDWKSRWEARATLNEKPLAEVQKHMQAYNPRIIPRNHIVEQVLADAVAGDVLPLFHYLEALQTPYSENIDLINYQRVPQEGWDTNYRTFCGT